MIDELKTVILTTDLPDHGLKAHVVQGILPTDEEEILAYVREHGSINNAECRRLLGVEDKRAWYLLNKLCNLDRLQQIGKGCWSRYTLP
jgi:predicted HTH transcriptional regulator